MNLFNKKKSLLSKYLTYLGSKPVLIKQLNVCYSKYLANRRLKAFPLPAGPSAAQPPTDGRGHVVRSAVGHLRDLGAAGRVVDGEDAAGAPSPRAGDEGVGVQGLTHDVGLGRMLRLGGWKGLLQGEKIWH